MNVNRSQNPRLSLKPAQSQSQPRPQAAKVFCASCQALLFILVVGSFILNIVWFLVLRAEDKKLKDDIKSLQSLHLSGNLEQKGALRTATKDVADDDFSQLLKAAQKKVGDGQAGITRLSDTALSNNNFNYSIYKMALEEHAKMHRVEENEYSFSVEKKEATRTAENAVRIPETGGIEKLDFDRLSSFTVCCRIESTKMICPTAEQMTVLVRNNPEIKEGYLKLVIWNDMYYDKECIFYWTQRILPQI